MKQKGWYAIDLDRTLAEYHGFKGMGHIGKPIPAMVERVKKWLAEGIEVRIFTARVHLDNDHDQAEWQGYLEAHAAILDFCVEQFGHPLPVTCSKDLHCLRIYDDLAIGVEANTGRLVGTYD